MGFEADFLEKLLARQKQYDAWNGIIDDMNKIKIQNGQLKREKASLEKRIESGAADTQSAPTGGVSDKRLEDENRGLKDEITSLLRYKSTTGDRLLELQTEKSNLEKELNEIKSLLEDKLNELADLHDKFSGGEDTVRLLKDELKTRKDEHTALQLAYSQLQKNYDRVVVECEHITSELLKAKEQMTELANSEAAMAQKLADIQKQHEIEAALQMALADPMSANSRPINPIGSYAPRSTPPTKKINEFAAHQGEVCDVSFSPDGYTLASGGDDKLVHLWDVSNPAQKPELKMTLRGCNSAVSSLSFASNRQHILGSANDYAARIWDLSTGKVLKTLTGHTGAVSAARYLSSTSVVTGSSDRTLRIWDLQKIACIKTLWPSSKCTDVASLAIDGSLIASAHFNKQVHFYDYRQKTDAAIVKLTNRVTGLAAAPDFGTDLLAVTRDNDVHVIDSRQMQTKTRLTDQNFKVVADYSRCTFSPCGGLALGVGSNGHVSCWDVSTSKLVDSASSSSAGPYISASWSSRLAAAGSKTRTVTLWG